MSELVGSIHYNVELNTAKMIDGQRKVDRELRNTTNSLDSFKARLAPIAAAISVMAVALASLKIARTADEFRLLGARVEVAAGSIESGAVAFSSLVEISRRTQSSLAGNIEVFNRLNQSILQMGGTQADTLQITELLAKAIKVSGASAVEAKAAMLQFGQALGSGKLQGDELRSLLENAPYLMKQLADGIGVPVGALKKLGEEGKLTADVVTNALTKAAATIDADFKKFPQTIESAMVVAQDAAGLAALKFDELTGSSAALTGVTKGLGEVLEKLADQFGAANEQAGALGRNGQITTWAQITRTAFSYVVDAADVVWQTLSVLGRNVAFVFKGIGAEIGGIGAQVKAVMNGDFSGAAAIGEAMRADAEKRRAELEAADAKTLSGRKLFGQQMREAWDQGAGGGRGFVNPAAVASQLTAPTGGDKKDAKKKRESTALEDDEREWEARWLRWQEKNEEFQDKKDEEEAKLAARGQQVAQDAIVGGDPIARLQLELQRKSELLAEYAAVDQDNLELYAQARVALEAQTAERIKEILDKEREDKARQASEMIQNYGGLFGNIADLTKTFAGEQSGAYKAMFAVSKGFAVADAIIKIQQGIANAAALPFPLNLGAMATVAASTAGIVSTIKGTNYGGGRQYGGPVSAGSMYRVNETGRPEMFTAANGSQYMMPTASGRVTAADKVGGGVQVLVQVTNNHPTAQVSTSTDDNGRIVQMTINEISNQFATNTGQAWNSLRGASNVQGRL